MSNLDRLGGDLKDAIAELAAAAAAAPTSNGDRAQAPPPSRTRA
jgi:hypothetical protein